MPTAKEVEAGARAALDVLRTETSEGLSWLSDSQLNETGYVEYDGSFDLNALVRAALSAAEKVRMETSPGGEKERG